MIIFRIVIGIILLGGSYINHYFGKRFVTGDYYYVTETDGRKLDRIGTFVILLVFFLLGWLAFDLNNEGVLKWLFLSFVVCFYSFEIMMEWKYLEGKKHLFTLGTMIVTVILILSVSYAAEQWAKTTYGEAITSLISKDEVVERIDLQWNEINEQGELGAIYLTSVTDQDTIKKLISGPSTMELERQNGLYPLDGYRMIIYTNKRNYRIYFNEDVMDIDSKLYKIQSENTLERTIINEEFDWEVR